MTAIAILALIGFTLGILADIFSNMDRLPHARPFLGAIMVISWWDISNPWAIFFLAAASLWAIICLLALASD